MDDKEKRYRLRIEKIYKMQYSLLRKNQGQDLCGTEIPGLCLLIYL